ncbi:MAG: DUF2326 domain-containing protein [Campylobacteraceae bacterium]|jgi:uncharacterized protein YydD (DUF2326 family)|nr:DUF2326 domain-containing protein [Campylobacteraceae bacterium]
MYLKKLIVNATNPFKLIREISFRKGLNLVTDEEIDLKTLHRGSTNSGNDIGKTTFLRAIDFCLGADSQELYYDRDDKVNNQEIKNFLIQNKISFTLYVGNDFESDGNDLILKRVIVSDNPRTDNAVATKTYINNEEIKKIREYTSQLNKIFFDYDGKKPTFRDLIPKFIREDKNSIESALRYLSAYSSDKDISVTHLFLFGFRNANILDEAITLSENIKTAETTIKTYTTDYGQKNALESEITLKSNNFKKLKQELKLLQEQILKTSNIENDLTQLNALAKEIDKLNSEIIMHKSKLDNINNSIKRFKTEELKVDINAIKELYYEAQDLLKDSNIYKTFEDTVKFHNAMLKNKIEFANSQKNMEKGTLKEKEDTLSNIIKQYNIQREDRDKEIFKHINSLNEEIYKLSEELGIKQDIYRKIEYNTKELSKFRAEQDKNLSNIDKNIKYVQSNIDIFNNNYSLFCKKLYGDEEYLSRGTEKLSPFEIHNNRQSGDGKKKAKIIAFDLAYTQMVNDIEIASPKFSAADKVELTDVSQIKTLFEIANNIDGQLIIPILRSKIEEIEDLVKDSIILRLNQKNKFFKF